MALSLSVLPERDAVHPALAVLALARDATAHDRAVEGIGSTPRLADTINTDLYEREHRGKGDHTRDSGEQHGGDHKGWEEVVLDGDD